MQMPADLAVDGQGFVHITIKTGGMYLHGPLLSHYAASFGLSRVVLRDPNGLLTAPEIKTFLNDRVVSRDIVKILWIDQTGKVTAFAPDEDQDIGPK